MKKTKNTPTRSKLTRSNGRAGNDTNPARASGKDTRLLLPLPQGALKKIAQKVKTVVSKKKYAATLFLTRNYRATVTIDAASYQEAYEKADDLFPSEVRNWSPWNWEIFISSIKRDKTGGRGHE